jgi:iron complex outermembrane receptor protein
MDKKIRLQTGTIEVHGDFSYRSKEQFQITAAPNDQNGYGLFGGRIEYRYPDELWSVAIFGTNLLDRRYRTAGRGTLVNQVGFAYSSVGRPREIGLQLRSRF